MWRSAGALVVDVNDSTVWRRWPETFAPLGFRRWMWRSAGVRVVNVSGLMSLQVLRKDGLIIFSEW
jgi:hypothetical protein